PIYIWNRALYTNRLPFSYLKLIHTTNFFIGVYFMTKDDWFGYKDNSCDGDLKYACDSISVITIYCYIELFIFETVGLFLILLPCLLPFLCSNCCITKLSDIREKRRKQKFIKLYLERYNPLSHVHDDMTCGICLDEFNNELNCDDSLQKCVKLECNHYYHI